MISGGMFSYGFMVNALLAATVVALLAGPVGYFLVLRGQSFAGHALAHVGFTGATGAVLLGLPPFSGLVAATLLAGLLMGALGEKLAGRDVAIGLVLALSLGFGLLFLHYFTAYAAQATALLFGNVFGVDRATLLSLSGLSLLSLAGLAFIGRPLLFASLQPELAEARGVPVRRLGMLFLALVALATAGCAQIIGVLLVFTLMVAPAATAQRLTGRPGLGVLLSAALALVQAWGGLVLAFETDWPASFSITALSGACYLLALLRPSPVRRSRRPEPDPLPAR